MRKALVGRGVGLLGAGAMAIGVLLACGVGTGCAVDTGSSSPAPLKEGLTILSADPAVGVSIAYKQSGRVVYLETKVGPLKEQPYLDAFPSDPTHEMDGRVVDQEGNTFSLVVGGDRLLDQGWVADLDTTVQLTTPAQGAQRDSDFALARVAASAFAAQAPPELADHVYHFTNMTARIPAEDSKLQGQAAVMRTAITDYSTCTYAQEGELYTIALGTGEGDVDGILGKIAQYISGAEHSSVYGWEYSSCTGGWTTSVQSCNHGNCAGSSGMSLSCWSGSGVSGPNPSSMAMSSSSILNYWSHETNTASGGINGACGTNYGIDLADITFYGGGDANHVCNDDSAMELDEIRNIRTDSNMWPGAASGGGAGGWNGSFSCQHWTHWYGPLDTDGTAPNCP